MASKCPASGTISQPSVGHGITWSFCRGCGKAARRDCGPRPGAKIYAHGLYEFRISLGEHPGTMFSCLPARICMSDRGVNPASGDSNERSPCTSPGLVALPRSTTADSFRCLAISRAIIPPKRRTARDIAVFYAAGIDNAPRHLGVGPFAAIVRPVDIVDFETNFPAKRIIHCRIRPHARQQVPCAHFVIYFLLHISVPRPFQPALT